MKEVSGDCRKATRHHGILEGSLVFGGRNYGIDVLIQDISAGGAKLVALCDKKFPAVFELLVHPEGFLYPARICWKRQNVIGIEFVGKPYPTVLPKQE